MVRDDGAWDSDLTVASGAALTFTTGNWDDWQTVTLTAAADADSARGTAIFVHAASGGDYDTAQAAELVATEVDDDARGYVFTTSALTVPEGGSAVYGVRLSSAPTGVLHLDVSPAAGSDPSLAVQPGSARLTFDATNWNVSQSVTLLAAQDADAAAGNAMIAHIGAGSDYDAIADNLTATEADDDAALVLSVASIDVPEGDVGTYGIKLAARPGGAVTVATMIDGNGASDGDLTVAGGGSLTFTTGNWDNWQTVTLAAAADADSANGTAAIAHTASGGNYDAAQAVELTAAEIDDDARGYVFTTSALMVPEGGSAVYGVRLSSAPVGVLQLDVSRETGGDPDLSVQPGGGVFDMARLTFNADNWNVYQSVTVLAAQDVDAASDSAMIAHVGNGSDYAGIQSAIGAAETDDDAALLLSTSTIAVLEGSQATYGVRLAARPGGAVTVSASVTDADDRDDDLMVAGGMSLTFTTGNWDNWQTVTLAAREDEDSVNGTISVTHSAISGDYDSALVVGLSAMEVDNDERGYVFTTSALTVPEGGSAVYGVHLSSAPTGVLHLDVSPVASSDPSLSVQPGSTRLTFDATKWDVSQSVTLLAAQDADAAAGSAMIAHRGSGSDYAGFQGTLAVNEADDDAALALSASSVTVPESGTATYGVRLAARPGSAVTVTAMVRDDGTWDGDLTVASGAALTFTTGNWDDWQTVTLTAAADADSARGTAIFVHAASGGDYDTAQAAELLATEIDDDARGYVFTTSALTVPEGGSAVYGIRLSSAPTGVLHLDISPAAGSDPSLSVQPGSTRLTFDATNWNVSQTVTLLAAPDADASADSAMIAHIGAGSDYDAIADNLPATEVDDDAALILSVASVAVPEGDVGTYGVKLAARPGGAVTVAAMIDGDGAQDGDLTVAGGGSLTFTTGNWDNWQTVTLAAAADADSANGTATIAHAANGGNYDAAQAVELTAH